MKMYSHVTVGSKDFEKSCQFYDEVMKALELKRTFSLPEDGWAGYGLDNEQPRFWFGKPYNQEAATFGNGVTIGFNAKNRKTVDVFYAAAMAHGGVDEGAPGLRPHYHPNYYGAYVRDPDGNKLCCCCHLPE
ncbi:VOC family protein [Microvirga sp. W0021]|uniref:VOC family protein n=1 Tax=Hohaiivirga grylli TaxID=3133970 RepID=A0ABV0BJ32_9HYPH